MRSMLIVNLFARVFSPRSRSLPLDNCPTLHSEGPMRSLRSVMPLCVRIFPIIVSRGQLLAFSAQSSLRLARFVVLGCCL